MSIIVKNGTVYDPANGIDGEKMDIFIKNSKIVSDDSNINDAKTIDASGKIVFPGGICIHSHIAGSNVNMGRLLRPEDMKRIVSPRRGITRAETGSGIPTTLATGQRFARMGYSLVCEPGAVPLKSKHTHEELHDIPLIDKLAMVCFDKNWVIIRLLAEGELEQAAAFAAWMLRTTKMYSIKVVNPGGTEAWAWGSNVETLDQPIPHWGISSREIISGLTKISEMLNIPHSVHLHANMLGVPGNYEITRESFDVAREIHKGTDVNRDTVLHMTHVGAFNSFGGESWKNICSKTDDIAKYMNDHEFATLDSGALVFGDWTTMTADGPVEYQLHRINGLKWVNNDIELETGAGIVPYVYSPKSLANSIMWAGGLELHLMIDNPWKCMLTTDHPNAGPFTRYPQIMAWLMSKEYREQTIKSLNKGVEKRTHIATLDREFTLSEIAITTRASQAKSLGLLNVKGHLGQGADADIAIYSIDPEKDDPSKNPELVMKAFSNAEYTIIGGVLVSKNGEIVSKRTGKTYWVNPQVDPGFEQEVIAAQRPFIEQYYSVNMRNFDVAESYLTRSTPIKTKTQLA